MRWQCNKQQHNRGRRPTGAIFTHRWIVSRKGDSAVERGFDFARLGRTWNAARAAIEARIVTGDMAVFDRPGIHRSQLHFKLGVGFWLSIKAAIASQVRGQHQPQEAQEAQEEQVQAPEAHEPPEEEAEEIEPAAAEPQEEDQAQEQEAQEADWEEEAPEAPEAEGSRRVEKRPCSPV